MKYIDKTTGQPPTLAADGTMCLLLEPDEYEREDEQYILTSHALRRKINPMLGLVVQYDFYEREMAKARQEGGQKFAECVAKLFNVYQTGRVTTWIKGDRIRPYQVAKHISDCRYEDGWLKIYVGMDFSHGDDLFAITYLGVNYNRTDSMRGHFLVDMDAWVLEETMKSSPLQPLYEQWVKAGYLRVCPGEVFDSIYAINALAEKGFEKGADGLPDPNRPRLNYVAFAYDPAQNHNPINQLKAWLQSIFKARGTSDAEVVKAIEQMVRPCSQGAMNLNPVIGHLEDMIKDGWLEFSDNPLWPWQFGNCAVEIGNTELRRIVKGGLRETHKMDNVAALLDALWAFDLAESNIDK